MGLRSKYGPGPPSATGKHSFSPRKWGSRVIRGQRGSDADRIAKEDKLAELLTSSWEAVGTANRMAKKVRLMVVVYNSWPTSGGGGVVCFELFLNYGEYLRLRSKTWLNSWNRCQDSDVEFCCLIMVFTPVNLIASCKKVQTFIICGLMACRESAEPRTKEKTGGPRWRWRIPLNVSSLVQSRCLASLPLSVPRKQPFTLFFLGRA